LDSSNDKRRARLQFVDVPDSCTNNAVHRHELEAEKKRMQRKVKDLTLRTNEDHYIRLRVQEKRREEDEQNRRKKDTKRVEGTQGRREKKTRKIKKA